jgi:hypothetical protein
MAISGGWVEKTGQIARESASQTNPLARYDVLSSEKRRHPGRGGRFPNEANGARGNLPERSQRPYYETKPMAISGRWVEKTGQIARESASQTNPLARYDVLSSEKRHCSMRGGRSPNEANGVRPGGFPERSQYQFGCVEFRKASLLRENGLPRGEPDFRAVTGRSWVFVDGPVVYDAGASRCRTRRVSRCPEGVSSTGRARPLKCREERS